MKRHLNFRAVVVAAALGLTACSNSAGPDGSRRTMGILQIEYEYQLMLVENTGVAASDAIRWDVLPGNNITFPPEVIEAPDAVGVGRPFEVIVHTVGPNGCWSADGLDVERVADRVMELTPWDLHSGAEACTMIFGYLTHPTTLTLDEPGEWTLRVRGRRVRGNGAQDGSVTAERTVLVLPTHSSEQPFDVELAPGDEILVDGAFRVAFTEVTEDSRCPEGVVCVWQGNAAAVIELTAGNGPTQPFTLNTGIEPDHAVHGGYRVSLLSVFPHPLPDTPIDQDDYRVTLRIESTQ